MATTNMNAIRNTKSVQINCKFNTFEVVVQAKPHQEKNGSKKKLSLLMITSKVIFAFLMVMLFLYKILMSNKILNFSQRV